MKLRKKAGLIIRGVALGCAVLSFVTMAKASPYASGCTNIVLGGSNYVQFVLNESGGSVYVVYEDNTTNILTPGTSTMPAGKTNFFLGSHTSYQIYVSKLGNGTPSQITVDGNAFNKWGNPRGVDINKNAKIGSLFGRIYIANATPSGTGTATRGNGLYALNADCSDSYLGKGTNASFSFCFQAALNSASPWNLSVNPDDNTVCVADYSTPNAGVFHFDPDFGSYGSNVTNYLVLGPLGENQGIAAGTHGDPMATVAYGSIATGNLVVYTFDPGLPAPSTAQFGQNDFGGQTTAGNYNCIFRYDIGAGPLPWTNAPNFAINTMLPGQIDNQVGSIAYGPDTNKIYASCRRNNHSDGIVQVYDRSGNLLYSSLRADGSDIFFVSSQAIYPNICVSPDGKYLAGMNINDIISVVGLTNGIPDESTFFTIANTPNTANARGVAFDAADNLYEVSSGQGLLRGFSLGNSAVAITGNDITGTNGTFVLQTPNTVATVAATQPVASQNYINSGGTPIPGVFTISLTTNFNLLPVPVSITLGGSAVFGTNYTINSTDANGVTYTKTNITFPAGFNPGGGNWTANLQIIPTATPVSGPSYTVTYSMVGGGNYVAGTPRNATLSIQNTGPQELILSSASGNTMSRSVPGDYAKFTITRWGDTNGPANSMGNVNPRSYTVTNFTYGGTAVFPVDYLAQAQRLDPAGDGVPQVPVAGSPGIVIKPGDVNITCVVGQPVANNFSATPTNVTITVDLTNSVTGTNLTAQEGYSYTTSPALVTLTELDNAYGNEVVIWNNPLTNSLDNSWNLTFASTNLGATTVLPALIPNYTNGENQLNTGGLYDYEVAFGNPVTNDNVPPSPYMTTKGWTNALRMTVNKDGGFSPAAVNVYPQGLNAYGNVALRFSMYLSLYDGARGTTSQGIRGWEYALFGIDHMGTNCNWRPTLATSVNGGSGVTNWDGQWFAVNAGSGATTPADYDAFNSPVLPNGEKQDSDLVSNPTSGNTGVFKNPPFVNDETSTGGNPANQWVDVGVEKLQVVSSNCFRISELINRSAVLLSFLTTSNTAVGTSGNYTNGTIMLGYEDPSWEPSDSAAFVYYSNVRVVELCPYLLGPLGNYIVLSGASLSFTNASTYSYAPGVTNNWYVGSPTGTALQTDTSATTNSTSIFAANSLTVGTTYYAVTSDSAGSITNQSQVEVVSGPANVTANQGSKAIFTVTATGPSAPTAYQWYTNGVALVNGTKYTNVTTANLGVSNVAPADALVTYSCKVTNPAGFVQTAGASLTITIPATGVVAPATLTALWGSSATFNVTAAGDPPITYQWKFNGANISDATNSSLTLTGLTKANEGSYVVGVTNAIGGSLSSAGVLTVTVPPPTFTGLTVSGGNIAMGFGSTNGYDTTNAFTLLSSTNISTPLSNWVVTSAVFTTNLTGGFTVTVPQGTNANVFYTLKHAQ